MHRTIANFLFMSALFLGTLVAPIIATGQNTPSPPPDPKIKVGDTAPDFSLRDQSGNQVKLSDFHGKKNVVLAFYIFAFTGG
jgi:cytochrome oxidase Cu insertion factor (SCO1/SenC/PrrC family)